MLTVMAITFTAVTLPAEDSPLWSFVARLPDDWPEADPAYYRKDEYVFGSEMLVAPVTKPVDENTQLASQEVWVPDGEWIELAREFSE